MTKRYNLTMNIDSNEDNTSVIVIKVSNKTMGGLQQLIRLAMSDFEKVDPFLGNKQRRGKPQPIMPPIEPQMPTNQDFELLTDYER